MRLTTLLLAQSCTGDEITMVLRVSVELGKAASSWARRAGALFLSNLARGASPQWA
jgi:hypothetical protein